MKVNPQEICQHFIRKYYGAQKSSKYFDPEFQFCTDSRVFGTCNGDSGGSVMINTKNGTYAVSKCKCFPVFLTVIQLNYL